MSDTTKSFASAGKFTPPTLQDLEELWTIFATRFNESAQLGRYDYYLHVSLKETEVVLNVVDMELSSADHLEVVSHFTVSINTQDQTYLLCAELERGEQEIHTYQSTEDEVHKLHLRCRAEILAAVGPDQGVAFVFYVKEKIGAAGGQKPVVH